MLGELRKTFLFVVYLAVHLASLLLASASQRQPTRYLNSALVLLTEVIKLLTSMGAIVASEGSRGARTIYDALFSQPLQLLRVCVPALLYAVQNNLIYASLAHVDAVTFQITYQLKILFSLLSMRLLLKRAVSRTKWLAVTLLTIGVMLVQLSLRPPSTAGSSSGGSGGSSGSNGSSGSGGAGSSSGAAVPAASASADASESASSLSAAATASAASTGAASESVAAAAIAVTHNCTDSENGEPMVEVSCSAAGPSAAPATGPSASPAAAGGASSSNAAASGVDADRSSRRSRVLGLVGLLVACFCSGLGGASMELLLKESASSLPRRNLQMAFVSITIGLLKLWSDRAQLRRGGVFQGFTRLVWAMVTLDASNGLLVSALLKYTSAVLKNFAAPLGIILNFFISRYILNGQCDGQRPNRQFIMGTLLVLLALGMYSSSA